MRNRPGKIFTASMVAALACIFIYGVLNLLLMRFDAGDVYPVYSSLRPDPLGTMALFESIAEIEGMAAERNIMPLEMMDEPGQATVFYPGLSASSINYMDQNRVALLHSMARDGARLVLLLRPERARRDTGFEHFMRAVDEKGSDSSVDDKDRCAEEADGKGKETEECDDCKQDVAPGREWASRPFYRLFRIHVGVMNAGDIDILDDDSAPVARAGRDIKGLPQALAWHSAAFMNEEAEFWETVYTLEGRPVAVQSAMGRGSVVIVTDPYYVTNEALLSAREPELVAWLIGDNSRVIFEESHMGVSEHPGVASLGRKYRLHWFALALLALALLFVWKNATGLVPVYRPPDGGVRVMSGKDYASGLVSLMRRNVSISGLVPACVEEWKRSLGGRGRFRNKEMDRVDSLLMEAGKSDPVGLYGKIDKILNERKR